MKLFSWNVNGLRSVVDKGAIDVFFTTFTPDVVCFQEIKVDEAQYMDSGIDERYPEYYKYFNFAAKKGYSGTAVWSKEEPLSVRYGFSDSVLEKFELKDEFGDANREGRLITAEFEQFWIVGTYSPHTKRNLERLRVKREWDDALLTHIQAMERTKPVVVCGDFNIAHREIDLANPKANELNAGFTKEERADFDKFVESGLIDTFRLVNGDKTGAYTWWTWRAKARERNIGWRIDYFLVSERLKNVVDAKIYPEIMGSDHCPVGLIIK